MTNKIKFSFYVEHIWRPTIPNLKKCVHLKEYFYVCEIAHYIFTIFIGIYERCWGDAATMTVSMRIRGNWKEPSLVSTLGGTIILSIRFNIVLVFSSVSYLLYTNHFHSTLYCVLYISVIIKHIYMLPDGAGVIHISCN